MARRAVFLGFLVLIQTGCFLPDRYTWRPGAHGVVVDHETHAPLSGACVLLDGPLDCDREGSRMARDAKSESVVTAADGRFTLDPIRRWYLRMAIPPACLAASRAMLTVTRDGYVGRQLEVVNSYSGTIELKKASSE